MVVGSEGGRLRRIAGEASVRDDVSGEPCGAENLVNDLALLSHRESAANTGL